MQISGDFSSSVRFHLSFESVAFSVCVDWHMSVSYCLSSCTDARFCSQLKTASADKKSSESSLTFDFHENASLHRSVAQAPVSYTGIPFRCDRIVARQAFYIEPQASALRSPVGEQRHSRLGEILCALASTCFILSARMLTDASPFVFLSQSPNSPNLSRLVSDLDYYR